MIKQIVLLLILGLLFAGFQAKKMKTIVSIKGDEFHINGKPTYEGRNWNGNKVQGLLINSRMVQGIFDDLNPETRERFVYPDTKKWDPDRNTRELVEAMDEWHRYGLNSFTLNLQGGSPVGYGNQKNWINSAYFEDGRLRPDFMGRLEKILNKADDLNMVVILGLFYFGQDQNLRDEQAIRNGVGNAIDWLFEKGYRNVLIEINNECNINQYDHEILKPERVHELIDLVRNTRRNGYRFLVSTSYGGNTIPKTNVVKSSDFILIHGNGVEGYEVMQTLIDNTRKVSGYRTMPVVVNEDDHFDFDKEKNNFVAAIEKYVSWGYFDYRKDGEDFSVGYQTVPVDWGINSARKKAFFNKVREITGGLK
ncbi:MAG TPA: hypothetical protein VFO54_07150 [Chryseosolibacter sp.]|nr:hypothetical protein [Chryseosolibacter sp.]